MPDDKKTATGGDKNYQELKRKNFSFSAFELTEPPTTEDELWNHAIKYYFSEKYKNTVHVFDVNQVFSEIIIQLEKELNPTISGKKPFILGDLNIFSHGRDVASPSGRIIGTEFRIRFRTTDNNNWTSPEELVNYIEAWERYSLLDVRNAIVNIKDRIDTKSTIWFRGCNIGKHRRLLQMVHKMFWQKPKVCGYDLRAWFEFRYNRPIANKEFTSAWESLIFPDGYNMQPPAENHKLKEGTSEFNNHIICFP